MKKKCCSILFAFLAIGTFAQEGYQVIWEENFNGYTIPSGVEGESDGDTNTNVALALGDYNDSFTKWRLNYDEASLQNFADYAVVFRNSDNVDAHFRVQDSGGDLHWETENIDVSLFENLSVSFYLGEVGDHETTDYVDVYYSVDNGVNYTMLENWKSLGSDEHTITGDTVLSESCNADGDFKNQFIYFNISEEANTLKLKLTFNNNSGSEYFSLDNVRVIGQQEGLGTQEVVGDLEYKLYPNPVVQGHELFVESNEDIASIKIHSIEGKLVKQVLKVNAKETNISVFGLPANLYIVSIESKSGKVTSHKVIIK